MAVSNEYNHPGKEEHQECDCGEHRTVSNAIAFDWDFEPDALEVRGMMLLERDEEDAEDSLESLIRFINISREQAGEKLAEWASVLQAAAEAFESVEDTSVFFD